MLKIDKVYFNKSAFILGDNLNLFVGPNGSGKSTLVRQFSTITKSNMKVKNKNNDIVKLSNELTLFVSSFGSSQLEYLISKVDIENFDEYNSNILHNDYATYTEPIGNTEFTPIFGLNTNMYPILSKLFRIKDLRYSEHLDFVNEELSKVFLEKLNLKVTGIEYTENTANISNLEYMKTSTKTKIHLHQLSESELYYLYLCFNLKLNHKLFNSTIVIDNVDMFLVNKNLADFLNEMKEISIKNNIQLIFTLNYIPDGVDGDIKYFLLDGDKTRNNDIKNLEG